MLWPLAPTYLAQPNVEACSTETRAMTLGGKTRLQHLFVQEGRGIFAQAAIMTGLHFVFMAGFFALYYGIQSLEYQA